MKKITILFFFLIINKGVSFGNEIQILAIVNNEPITNYDLYLEAKLKEISTGKKIFIDERFILIENIINQKIKSNEIKKNNINIKISNEEKKVILNKFENKMIPDEIKNYILRKIEIEKQWEYLIYLKYGKKLEINTSELNELNKDKKINSKDKEILINKLKNKKLYSLSRSFFNEIKKYYYIKKF